MLKAKYIFIAGLCLPACAPKGSDSSEAAAGPRESVMVPAFTEAELEAVADGNERLQMRVMIAPALKNHLLNSSYLNYESAIYNSAYEKGMRASARRLGFENPDVIANWNEDQLADAVDGMKETDYQLTDEEYQKLHDDAVIAAKKYLSEKSRAVQSWSVEKKLQYFRELQEKDAKRISREVSDGRSDLFDVPLMDERTCSPYEDPLPRIYQDLKELIGSVRL